jgi:hypothetical protein
MEAKTQSPSSMAAALLPTVILLIAAANGHADPAAKVAQPKMDAARPSPPARPREELTGIADDDETTEENPEGNEGIAGRRNGWTASRFWRAA